MPQEAPDGAATARSATQTAQLATLRFSPVRPFYKMFCAERSNFVSNDSRVKPLSVSPRK